MRFETKPTISPISGSAVFRSGLLTRWIGGTASGRDGHSMSALFFDGHLAGLTIRLVGVPPLHDDRRGLIAERFVSDPLLDLEASLLV